MTLVAETPITDMTFCCICGQPVAKKDAATVYMPDYDEDGVSGAAGMCSAHTGCAAEYDRNPFDDASPLLIIVDGFLVHPETGEVLGHVDAAPAFTVDSLESAEWVMEKLQATDSEIAGLEMRLQAQVEQIQAMIEEKGRKRKWLEFRFKSELETFAAEKLEGLKVRSLKTPFGSIGFRNCAGSIKPLDKQECINWAHQFAPDALVQRWDIVVTPLQGRTDLPSQLFDVSAPGDKFFIRTGVK